MRRYFLFLFVLTTFSIALFTAGSSAYTKAIQGDVEVTWQFDIQKDNYGNPQGKVFLVADGRKVLIRPKATAEYSVLDRADYQSKDVPAAAITASTGWWAGQGEDMYVIRRKNQLIVFIRYLDEGTSIPPYKRLKVVPLP